MVEPADQRKGAVMDFLEALDSIRREVPDEAYEEAVKANPIRNRERAQRDRDLVAMAQNHATTMLNEKRAERRDRYEIEVWLVTLEVWDAMLRVADFKGRTPELRWEGIPVVPTNLDLPAGIALATLDPVNAAMARMAS